MEIKIVNNKEGFLALKPEWEALQIKANQITYYSTFDYLYNRFIYVDNNQNITLSIICVYEKNEVIGIAPLMVENRKHILFHATVIRFIGVADTLGFLIDKNSKRQSVLKKIFETINTQIEWDKIDLPSIASNSDLAHFCFKSELYNLSFNFFGENPVLFITESLEFPEYKKLFFKKNINYYRNKLKKDLNANLEIVFGDSEFENITNIHKERNSNSKERDSLFAHSGLFNFTKILYRNEETAVTFLLKTEDGEIISYATGFIFNNILHNWNTSYNPKYRDYSAGDLIYFEMINYVFENKKDIKLLDFGGGRYPWKFRMTDDFISTYRLNLNNENSKKLRLLNWYDKIFKIAKAILK